MKLTKIEPIINSLPNGTILRKTIALALRILTGVAVFLGLFTILDFIGTTIDVIDQSPAQALGALISIALIIIAMVIAVKILLLRAKNILAGNQTEYPIIHLSLPLLRTAGDMLALYYTTAGLIAGIMHWFGGNLPITDFWQMLILSSDAWRLLLSSGISNIPSVILGLGIILSSLIQGLISLLFFYLLAELLIVLKRLTLK